MAKVNAKDLALNIIEQVQKDYGLEEVRMAKTKAWPCFKNIMNLILKKTMSADKQRVPLAGVGVFYITKSRKKGGLKSFRFKACAKMRAAIK